MFHLPCECYTAVKHVVNDSPAISVTHSQAHQINKRKQMKTSFGEREENESLNRNGIDEELRNSSIVALVVSFLWFYERRFTRCV